VKSNIGSFTFWLAAVGVAGTSDGRISISRSGLTLPFFVCGMLTVLTATAVAGQRLPIGHSTVAFEWSVGGVVSTGDGVFDGRATRVGGRLSATASRFASIHLELSRIVNNGIEPVTEVTGTRVTALLRLAPGRSIWYLAGGFFVALEEFYREGRPLLNAQVSPWRGFGPMVGTGVRLPLGRLCPFAEIRLGSLLSGPWAGVRTISVGLELGILGSVSQ
jgi:hypothetical protein